MARIVMNWCKSSRTSTGEKKGGPLWSPEIDWFAAEKAARAYLLDSGIELGPGKDLYS
jgi:hypothetical protein